MKSESEHLIMHRLQDEGDSSRWCFRVPKTVGSAVRRNRVRRLMREYLRTNKALWPERSALIVTAKTGAANLDFETISHQLERLLKR